MGPSTRDTVTVTLTSSDDNSFTLGTTHIKDVTILEGVCDRSAKIQEKILAAVSTATACHEVTDSDLATDLSRTLYWGGGKLSGHPLKPGDFRGMTGVTGLYHGEQRF